MIAHFVICHLGSKDLLELAIASVHKFAGDATLDLIEIPTSSLGDANAHGRALDQWVQNEARDAIPDDDVVVIMDPDVAILSHTWRIEMERTFKLLPKCGVWGAGCREDFGLRIHPSMMAIRGSTFNQVQATFRPFHRPSDKEWLDTAGWYCKCVVNKGWKLWREERALGHDWHGAAAWYDVSSAYLRHRWDHDEKWPLPMWVHLGGGTWSDPQLMTWWQRQRRRSALTKRRQFISAVKEVLSA